MKQKTNPQKKSFFARLPRKILLGIIAGLLVVIIVLVIILISNSDKTAETAAQSSSTERITVSDSSSNENWIEVSGKMVYNNDEYNTISGIDVSEWNGDIDWEKVKADGIEFAIVRVGYRGYGTGKFVMDNNIESYLSGAEAAGIKTGLYFVSQAVSEEEAEEEAELCLKYAKDHDITMPIYIDLEDASSEEARTDDNTKEDWAKIAKAFCSHIEEAGYKGGIYSNETWVNKHLVLSDVSDYDLWIANYIEVPETDTGINMWQYNSEGSIDGITTYVDLNARIEMSQGDGSL